MRVVTLLLFVVASLPSVFAQEKKIQRADLPPAVETTVAAVSHGAAIKGFSEEKENGLTYYEAEMLVDGHSKDVLIDTKGAVAEVEEQVELDSLPTAVRSALQTKAGAGKITKVESIAKHDKIVAYEAQVRSGAKRSEIQVGPQGQALDHEE